MKDLFLLLYIFLRYFSNLFFWEILSAFDLSSTKYLPSIKGQCAATAGQHPGSDYWFNMLLKDTSTL